MLDDYEVRGEFQQNYQYAHDFWAPYQKDAQVYTLAASGYTWSDDERKALIKEGREPIEYNIMRRPLQFYSGYLRDNINEVIYSPVEGSDQKTADQFTKLGYYIWDKGQGFPKFLDAADECFKSGISLCGLQMDYSRDLLNGDIKFFNRTYNSFYPDPTFESLDLVDCSFVITRDLIDKQYAKQLLPFVDAKVIDELCMSYRDDKFMQYHPQFTTFSRKRNLIAYDQYYKRISKKRKFLVDLKASFYRDITDLPKEDIDKLKLGISRFNNTRAEADVLGIDENDIPELEIITRDIQFVELNVLLNGQRVYCGEDKTGINKTFPFVLLICYFEPSIWMPSQRLQGVSSTMWSLQRQFNKRHMKITDMMDSSISTGYKYLIGSVADPQDLQQSGQNKLIGVDPENAPQGLDSVQELRGGNTSPELIQYQQVLDQLNLTLANVTESVIGIDEKGNTQISGRLAEVRIAQGLRSSRKVLENIETAQLLLGGLVLQAIQANYAPGKVERIIGETPTDQFYEREFEQYDAVIKQGVRSKSQKDAYYYELVNLAKDGIVDVPQAEILKALSMSGGSDLQEAIEVQDKMKAEQVAKINEQEKMALELANSQKIANLALSKEREARVIADIGLAEERHSEAASNMADAVLARAKAIVEISNLQEDRIMKIYQFLESLQKEEAAQQEFVSEKTRAMAEMIEQRDEYKQAVQTQSQQQNAQEKQEQVNQQLQQGG